MNREMYFMPVGGCMATGIRREMFSPRNGWDGSVQGRGLRANENE